MHTFAKCLTTTITLVVAMACRDSAVVEPENLSGKVVAVASVGSYAAVSFSAGTNPSAAKIGDLDGDGRNDIAVVNLQGSLQLFFNNGAGSFARLSLNGLWPSSSSTGGVDIGDLNGDGRNDIAVAFTTQTGSVSVLLNQGNRTFGAPVNYNVCGPSVGVAIGDLDQDGDNDLADVNQCSKTGVLLNNGTGSFALGGVYGSGANSRSIALADFNRDGFKDIAYLNATTNGYVRVLFNNRNGTFGSPQALWAGDLPDDLTTGDFNGDGYTDISIANSYLGLVIQLFNDSQGTFMTGYSELDGGQIPTSIVSGDFNGDGRLDYAVASQVMNEVRVFTNQDGYNYVNAGSYYVPQTPVDIAAGRLDGDLLPDLVSVNSGSGNITVLFSGTAAPPPPPPPPPPQIALIVSTRKTLSARLVDLKWTGATSSTVDIYRNGSRIATKSNTGNYTDRFDRRTTGTFRYKICVAGGSTCSSEAAISF